jgi:hypothetical protein
LEKITSLRTEGLMVPMDQSKMKRMKLPQLMNTFPSLKEMIQMVLKNKAKLPFTLNTPSMLSSNK